MTEPVVVQKLQEACSHGKLYGNRVMVDVGELSRLLAMWRAADVCVKAHDPHLLVSYQELRK